MSYDGWKEAAPEDNGAAPPPCPVCTGDMDAPPCGEECDALIRRCERERQIKSYYLAARRALWWARSYYGPRRDPFGPDARVLACVDQTNRYRKTIAQLRAQGRPKGECPMVIRCIDAAPTCAACKEVA